MPLRTFYIIIKSDYVDNKGYLNLFPWMKIHGSIEARPMQIGKLCPILGFHEWKFMALLKRTISVDGVMWRAGFHEWKFMALLKPITTTLAEANYPVFPWMKIHGSIEASISWTFENGGAASFHEWKFMALLKLFLSSPVG